MSRVAQQGWNFDTNNFLIIPIRLRAVNPEKKAKVTQKLIMWYMNRSYVCVLIVMTAANDDLCVNAMFDRKYRACRCDSQSHILYDSFRVDIVVCVSTYTHSI
jgi:hypothetical protein